MKTQRHYLFDTDDDGNEIPVIVEYYIDRSEPETGYFGSCDIVKIKYGHKVYSDEEDFKLDYPECFERIEQEMDKLYEEDSNRSAWDHDFRED